MTYQELVPPLKPYFELDEKIELPTVLFFQEHNGHANALLSVLTLMARTKFPTPTIIFYGKSCQNSKF